jgi:hypothetical protein
VLRTLLPVNWGVRPLFLTNAYRHYFGLAWSRGKCSSHIWSFASPSWLPVHAGSQRTKVLHGWTRKDRKVGLAAHPSAASAMQCFAIKSHALVQGHEHRPNERGQSFGCRQENPLIASQRTRGRISANSFHQHATAQGVSHA